MTPETALVAILPELILLIGACAVLLVGVMPRMGTRASALAFLTVVGALIATLLVQVPDAAAAPFGLWVTSLTFYVRCIALSVGALIVLVNWHQPAPSERGEYMSLILFSLLGVLLTASANDLIVLFFAIELVSIPTYVLVALSRDDARSSEAAVKYFFLGAMSAAILAYGLSFLYGAAGTTTLYAFSGGAATSNFPHSADLGAVGLIGLLLVFCGLAFKVAAVPFHVYVADVYEGAAAPVAGLLGFIPKLAGFVALVKIFAAFNWELPEAVTWMVLIVAAVTMTAGNVLALLQKNVKRLLAYSSIAHTGYMLMGLLVGPVAGLGPLNDGVAALLFYIAIYGVMNLGAFAALSAFRSAGHEVETFEGLGGLAKRAPVAAFALAVCVFSLMGFPPTAGFLGKLYLFSSAFSLPESHPFHQPMILLVILGVVNAAIGAAYYLRIVMAVYMGEEVERAEPTGGAPVRWGLGLCSAAMLVVFIWPTGLADRARSATVVLHPSIMRNAGKMAATEFDANTRPPLASGRLPNAVLPVASD